MTFKLICVLSILCLPLVNSLIKEAPLPIELQKCYNQFARKSLATVVGKSVCWYCETPLRTRMHGAVKPLQAQQKRYLNSLSDEVHHSIRRKRQAGRNAGRNGGGRRCVRKEYRMLTVEERRDYHRAVNMLKSNTSVLPNQYDSIAMVHVGEASLLAHGGPNFFGWHRMYLMMYEAALHRKVPGVCLPYIDNTIEAELGGEDSYLFSDEFLGTSNGAVTSGPFANWRTDELGPLTRNVGNQAFPMDKDIQDSILSRSTMREISSPTAELEYDLEYHHGAFHIFVGGTMESIDTASFEPLFFMHHCYIDYVWEQFRTKMRNNGGDPHLYPEPENLPLHAGNTPIRLVTGMRNSQAYGDITTYDYMPSPVCSRSNPDCGSRYLACNITSYRCFPIDPATRPINPGPINPGPINPGPINPGPINPGPINPGHINPWPVPGSVNPGPINPGPINPINPWPVPGPANPVPVSTGSTNTGFGQTCFKRNKYIKAPKSCQNTYCIDGKCDINQWIYFPVKIITNRAPGFKGIDSFPVRNGVVQTVNDIYAPKAYTIVTQYIKPKAVDPKGYGHCDSNHGIGQIFISSQGISYQGHYSESSIIDQRMAVSISIAYMAVKNMGTRGKTTSLLRAFDQCGRICHTACKIPGTIPSKYRPCSGVVDITPDFPKQYGSSYGESLVDVWGYRKDRECPVFDGEDLFMAFYCDYQDRLPWVNATAVPVVTKPIHPIEHPLPSRAPLPVVTKPIHPMAHPLSAPAPLPQSKTCRISATCSVDLFCQNRKCRQYGRRFPCIHGCSHYALCVYGKLWERSCPHGMIFNPVRNRCLPGSC